MYSVYLYINFHYKVRNIWLLVYMCALSISSIKNWQVFFSRNHWQDNLSRLLTYRIFSPVMTIDRIIYPVNTFYRIIYPVSKLTGFFLPSLIGTGEKILSMPSQDKKSHGIHKNPTGFLTGFWQDKKSHGQARGIFFSNGSSSLTCWPRWFKSWCNTLFWSVLHIVQLEIFLEIVFLVPQLRKNVHSGVKCPSVYTLIQDYAVKMGET